MREQLLEAAAEQAALDVQAKRGAKDSALGRYCCKSRKLLGANFFVRKQKFLRSPINMAPSSLPKSSVSLSPGNEVPHIFIQESHQRPRKILVCRGKGLLQHNRPQADSCIATKSLIRSPHRRWRAASAALKARAPFEMRLRLISTEPARGLIHDPAPDHRY